MLGASKESTPPRVGTPTKSPEDPYRLHIKADVPLASLKKELAFPKNHNYFHRGFKPVEEHISDSVITAGRKKQIAMSKEQGIRMALKRVSKERAYWTQALNEAVKGVPEDEVTGLLVRYAKEINFEAVSEEERQFFTAA